MGKTEILLIKGAISEMKPEDQARVKLKHSELKRTYDRLNAENDGTAAIAFALLGAELAATNQD